MPVVRRLPLVALAIVLTSVAVPVGAASKPTKPVPALPIGATALAPGNDAFASATDVAVGATITGSNVGATTEDGEPLPCGDIGATVWYRLTVSEAANVAASTGGGLDTVLAAYRGTTLGGLEQLGCNDDAGWGLTSKVGFAAAPGETYYLQLGGYAGERGGFSLSVEVGGSISGVVTGEGEDLGAVCVDLFTAEGEWLEYAFVEGPAASYRFDGLPAGGYAVGFFDCSGEPRHIDEYYDDAGDLEAATVVSVVEGAETSGIDAVLALGATISGTVTGADATPLSATCVDVVRPDGSWVTFAWGQGGSYTVGGLAQGDYLLRFEDCESGEHAYEWHDDADSRVTATPVTVEAGQAVAGVDAQLPLGATIRGMVTDDSTGAPLASVCIAALDAAGDHAGWGYGAGSYGYEVGGLRGEVRLRYDDCGDGTRAYEWYDDAATRAEATPVATAEGQETSGIDAGLGPAGWIRGRVTNHVGAPIRWACVEAYDASGEWAGFDETGGQGRYTLRGLRGADYRIHVGDCWDGLYRDQWYDDAVSMAEADPVAVVTGAVTGGIDAVLETPRLVFLGDQGSTEVAEGGDDDRFGVGLGQASTSEIAVTLETDGQIAVEPSALSFAAGDATAREIQVRAVDDDLAEGPHWSVVTLRTNGDDPVLGDLVQRFWVFVEDDDLTPAATEIVYEGDTSAVRGTQATLAARLIDAETGEGIPYALMRTDIGMGPQPSLWTDEDGYAEFPWWVSAPYGQYELEITYEGNGLLAPSALTVPFEVRWQHVFEDDLAAGRSVLWNPPTRELRFVAPGDTSEIKEQPTNQTLISPTGHRVTVLGYADESLIVELDWERETSTFAAAVKTPSNAYALQGRSGEE